MAHTPGPWKWLYVQDVSGNLLPDSPELIYRVAPVMRVSDYAIINEDDARLISAAPEMLEALKAVLEDREFDLERVRAIVAKAEGQP